MKKGYLLILFIAILNFNSFGQSKLNVDEPEYIGEAINVSETNAVTPLEKQSVKIQTKAGASVFLVGVGKVKSKMVIEGGHSPIKFKTGKTLTFIVKSFDNKSDPLSIISIFKFESTKSQRKTELSSAGTFSGSSQNNQNFIPYKSKKYKESSYEINIESPQIGEYGILVSNPNALANSNTIIACFSIE